MPTRRLPDTHGWVHNYPCQSTEHFPPTMVVWQPGTYEHICPSCGHKIIFTVSGSFYY